MTYILHIHSNGEHFITTKYDTMREAEEARDCKKGMLSAGTSETWTFFITELKK